MFTQVKTPHEVFFNPQRLLVPLFQRPYVWSLEGQWRLLWEDVRRVADKIVRTGSSAPHFLGAVVLQQQPTEIGTITVRTVIDGQQRLTTLQILLDAVHGQVLRYANENLAKQALDLVENPQHFTQTPEDRFKVWPTNRDRAAFNEVMSADTPLDYSALANRDSRLVRAHEYFSREIMGWFEEGDSEAKANAIVTAVSRYLQLVVIDLQADEDAQEIFETLNARGTPLTAADLIKNFVFQRLNASPAEAESSYHQYWEQFETPFWETEVSAGRMVHTRSSLFLTQWLVAQTKQDVTAREVFSKFKNYISDSNLPVQELLPRLRNAADVYRDFTEGSRQTTGSLSRLELFVYRISTLDSEVLKPILIWLYDPNAAAIQPDQLNKALNSLESWAVRRSIVRATTQSYNRLVVDMLTMLANADRSEAGDVIERFLASQTSNSSYWPNDDDIRRELRSQPIYKRLARSRLRMIIEALEDHRRGFKATVGGRLSESAVPRSVTSIEHVMPQEWRTSWPGAETDDAGVDRDVLVHTLGNLTLVTQALNSKVSNSAWLVKKKAFIEHTTLLLTADLVNAGDEEWGAEKIHRRGKRLTEDILEIWPVPANNRGLLDSTGKIAASKTTVADLVQAGLLRPGQILYARTQAHKGKQAFVSEDGGLFVDGVRSETPSGAAEKVTGSGENGWWFWVTDLAMLVSLSDLRHEYGQLSDVDDLE